MTTTLNIDVDDAVAAQVKDLATERAGDPEEIVQRLVRLGLEDVDQLGESALDLHSAQPE